MEKRQFFSGNLQASFCAAALLAVGAALLAYPLEVQKAVLSSTMYCLSVLTPSLFPFMVLTSYAVRSGADSALGKLLGFLPRLLFRLPRCCAAPIILSFIGGYPAGAKAASLLLKKGALTRAQAGRMMLFCVNPGLAFVVTFLGGAVLGNFFTGWLLFCAVTLAGVLLGIVSAFFVPFPEEPPCVPSTPGAGALTGSAVDACSTILRMSACVVLFSGFTALLHGSGIYQGLVQLLSRMGIFSGPQWAVLLSFLIEVTGGVGNAASFHAAPGFYAFGLAFAGLCVHLQVFSFFEAFPISKWKFFLFRFLHGFLAALLFWGLSLLFPHAVPAAVISGSMVSGGLSTTVAGGATLLMMCSALLLILAKGKDCNEEKNVIG